MKTVLLLPILAAAALAQPQPPFTDPRDGKKCRRKRQKWSKGSLFKVPLLDGSYVIGLVLEIFPDALNSFVGSFYNCRTASDKDISIHDIDLANPDMVLFVTRDLIDFSVWPVIKDGITNVKAKDFLNLSKLKSKGFVGVTVTGSGVIINAFNILNNLSPNNFANPGYLYSLLYNDSYEYDDEELTIKSIGKKISFPYEIYKVLACMDMFIVLLYSIKENAKYNRNLFGVRANKSAFGIRANCKIIWQVKDTDNPFTDIILENGELIAYSKDSSMYKINPATGEIICIRPIFLG